MSCYTNGSLANSPGPNICICDLGYYMLLSTAAPDNRPGSSC